MKILLIIAFMLSVAALIGSVPATIMVLKATKTGDSELKKKGMNIIVVVLIVAIIGNVIANRYKGTDVVNIISIGLLLEILLSFFLR